MKKYEMIYKIYKDNILAGFLRKGDRIDSIRACALKYDLSKTTIETAYDKLVMDGFIESKEKMGFIVSMDEEQISLHKDILEYSKEHKEENFLYDFRVQSVSIDSFESTIWKRYIKKVMNDKQAISTYGMAQGEYALRQALCKYVYQSRNILCYPEQIVMGSNNQSLLYIFCGMLDKTKRIGLSRLVDLETLQVFRSYGFEIEFLSTNHFVEDIQKKRVDVIYVNTTCFFENKKAMDEKTRKKLLDIKNILILEDDYNGELAYASKMKSCLFSRNKNVIYFSSFSRVLLPSFRMSYMILNEDFEKIYQQSNFGPTASKIEQLAFTQYILDGYLKKHVRKLIREYKDKYSYLKRLLDTYIPLPKYLDETYMAYWLDCAEKKEKIQLVLQKNSFGVNWDENRFGLSFASMDKEMMKTAIIRLAEILKEC